MRNNIPIFVLTFLAGFPIIATQINRRQGSTCSQDQQSSSFNQKMFNDRSVQNRRDVSFPYQQDILPKNVVPEKYHLWIKPNTDGKTDFCGEVTIELKCVHSTKYIILHSKNLTITDYRLYKNITSQLVGLFPMKTNMKKDQILFEAKVPLVSGEGYKLFIGYRGHMKDADIKANTAVNGFFRRSYFKKDGSRKTYVYTILSFNSTKTALPCFNELELKSQFLVTIEHDRNLTAVTNTPLVKQVPRTNGMVESIFEPTVIMSTYHLAFAISDFANVSTTTPRGTKVSACLS